MTWSFQGPKGRDNKWTLYRQNQGSVANHWSWCAMSKSPGGRSWLLSSCLLCRDMAPKTQNVNVKTPRQPNTSTNILQLNQVLEISFLFNTFISLQPSTILCVFCLKDIILGPCERLMYHVFCDSPSCTHCSLCIRPLYHLLLQKRKKLQVPFSPLHLFSFLLCLHVLFIDILFNTSYILFSWKI